MGEKTAKGWLTARAPIDYINRVRAMSGLGVTYAACYCRFPNLPLFLASTLSP